MRVVKKSQFKQGQKGYIMGSGRPYSIIEVEWVSEAPEGWPGYVVKSTHTGSITMVDHFYVKREYRKLLELCYEENLKAIQNLKQDRDYWKNAYETNVESLGEDIEAIKSDIATLYRVKKNRLFHN